MKNREYNSDGLYKKDNQTRAIAFTPEFEKWIKNHEGVIVVAVSVIESIEAQLLLIQEGTDEFKAMYNWEFYSNGEKSQLPKPQLIGQAFEKSGVRVRLEMFKPGHNIYKVQVDDDIFFVKREDNTRQDTKKLMGGVREIEASARMKKLLKSVEGVEVIDFKLGYEDKNLNKKYFVATWESDVIDLPDYLITHPEEIDRISSKCDQIRAALPPGFFEVISTNMFYNPIKQKIIIFDVNLN